VIARDVPQSERGAATLVMLGVVVLGLAFCLLVSRAGVAAIAGARAETAADAAALAAGDTLALGRGPAAARSAAAQTARANGATLSACGCSGPFVTVRVVVAVPALDAMAAATARAEVRLTVGGR
jgi:hypothetical protein